MRLLAGPLLAAATALLTMTSAAAADRAEATFATPRTAAPTFAFETKRRAAWKVAQMLNDRSFPAVLDRHLSPASHRASLGTVLDEYRITSAQAQADADEVGALDKQLRERKGIAGRSRNLLELQLYVPKNYLGRLDWRTMPVAYVPAGKHKTWTSVEAFDRAGHSMLLDARKAPSQPVLIAGIDRKEDQRAGLAVVNERLQLAGLQAPAARTAATTTMDTTKLTRITLKDDEEPWILGAAEIYAVVSGVQPDQAQAALTVVDMPYLDYDGTVYSPNQIMIFWNGYRYGAANIQLFEHDDNTNYHDLAIALSQGVTTILGAFAPTYAVIGQVATAILQAMPSSWFTNDDDYVDSFYTLEKDRSYVNYVGAANNATVTLVPYSLAEQ
jgi:hypothetical protein